MTQTINNKNRVSNPNQYLAEPQSAVIQWQRSDVNFYALQMAFERLFNEILEKVLLLTDRVDKVAERIRHYSEQATTIMNDFVAKARLSEASYGYPDIQDMVATQVSNHEAVIEFLSDDIATFDENSEHGILVDLLACLLKQHAKLASILLSWVEAPSADSQA